VFPVACESINSKVERYGYKQDHRSDGTHLSLKSGLASPIRNFAPFHVDPLREVIPNSSRFILTRDYLIENETIYSHFASLLAVLSIVTNP
jgi:hypothetical protein